MCNCRENTEKRLVERVRGQIPSEATGLSVSLEGYALLFGGSDGVTMKNCMPVKIQYSAPNRKGDIKLKKESINMIGNYCMFCGEKYAKEDAS